MTAALVLMAFGVTLGLLLRPRVRTARAWQSMVTPLASIIGSGFLVVVPLLAGTVGPYAPVAMLGVVLFAYAIGGAIRFVIAYGEERLAAADAPHGLVRIERSSEVLLAVAYTISVAFYLRLLASFMLREFGGGEFRARLVATAMLVLIAAVAWFRGLHGLELLEEGAVTIKLAIIAGLVVGLAVHDLGDVGATVDAFEVAKPALSAWSTVRVLAGTLLVVQGFETVRYLGDRYDAATRIRAMRMAQLVSGAIYLVFVTLAVRTFTDLPDRVDETAILDVVGNVTAILVPMLIVAAVASQLSAAVADTAGGGEMITPVLPSRRDGLGELVLLGVAALVVWSTDVFGIVSLASRAFAAYYAAQTFLAYRLAHDAGGARWRRAWYLALAAVLVLVAVFAEPV